MTKVASILIGPVLTLQRFNDPMWAQPERTLYERGSLRLWPDEEHPLLIDHRPDKRIGTVSGLDVIEWVDGPWIYARATVDDAPSWLKRGTHASFGYGVVHERVVTIRESRAEVVAKGFVSEVSVLSPGRRPKEPRAHVVSFRKSPAVGAPPVLYSDTAGEALDTMAYLKRKWGTP